MALLGRLSSFLRFWRRASGEGQKSRPLNAVQVEVTTRCNHRCLMCPRNYTRTTPRDLAWDLYVKLSSFFSRINLVFLQGWGEPLLHPRFWDMVALARERGCTTGFTTNGSLLEASTAREIISLDVGYVTVSLAGATAQTHDCIRRGSDFQKLTANVARLVELKKSTGAVNPKVHLSFMLTGRSIGELPAAVRLAHELEVDQLVAPNLDCPITPEDEQNRIFDWDEPDPAHEAAITEAQLLASRLGVKISVYPLRLTDDVLVCELNPLKQFFLNVQCEVAPCVYTGMPEQDGFHRYFRGEKVATSTVCFGSLAEKEMAEIWDEVHYREFRSFFAKRLRRYAELINRSPGIRNLFELERFGRDIDRVLRENPFPPVCRQCYKAYGA